MPRMEKPIEISSEKLWEQIEQSRRDRAEKLPDERACLNAMFEAYQRLQELGWKEAIYCPKDGSVFHSIEAGSTGIHDCHYEGEWPKGWWWVHEANDLWPSRPILFKPKEKNHASSDPTRSEVF